MIQGVYNGVTTAELDELAAQTAAYCATQHPDFSLLAARISISNLHKNTTKNFSERSQPVLPHQLTAADYHELLIEIDGADAALD